MKKRLPIALLVVACVAAVLVVVYRTKPGDGGILPPCMFYKATGFHCSGCGITRAMHHLLHLRVGEALAMNPLVVATLPLIALGVVMEGVAWIAGEGYRGPRVRLPAWGYWLLLGAIISYWILRNIPFWPFTLLAPH